MTHLLKSLAGGRVILCLEGGYNVTSISYAMTLCTKALLGDPIHHHYDPKPTTHWSAIESINNVISVHKKYWKNLKFQLALPIENVIDEPLPSRGLTITDDQNESHEKLAEISSTSSLDDSKSKSQLDGSLEINMANLSIDKPKCEDGIHCGTDDEDTPEGSKNKSDPGDKEIAQTSKKQKKCDTTEKEVEQGGSSKKENEVGSSQKGEQKATLVDYLAENMQAIVDGEMFAVIPLPWCPHLESLYAMPSDVKFEQGVKCVDCDETVENWVCLHCYIVSIFV